MKKAGIIAGGNLAQRTALEGKGMKRPGGFPSGLIIKVLVIPVLLSSSQ